MTEEESPCPLRADHRFCPGVCKDRHPNIFEGMSLGIFFLLYPNSVRPPPPAKYFSTEDLLRLAKKIKILVSFYPGCLIIEDSGVGTKG